MRREFERWLLEAKWDLDTALILHRERRFNAAAFYSQQAAEKAMKALLLKKNESAWGQSVRELLIRFSDVAKMNIDEKKFLFVLINIIYCLNYLFFKILFWWRNCSGISPTAL